MLTVLTVLSNKYIHIHMYININIYTVSCQHCQHESLPVVKLKKEQRKSREEIEA